MRWYYYPLFYRQGHRASERSRNTFCSLQLRRDAGEFEHLTAVLGCGMNAVHLAQSQGRHVLSVIRHRQVLCFITGRALGEVFGFLSPDPSLGPFEAKGDSGVTAVVSTPTATPGAGPGKDLHILPDGGCPQSPSARA